MRMPTTAEEYQDDLRRFMRVAVGKQARLIIFPELGGVLLASLLLGGFQAGLLKRTDQARRRQAGVWDRLQGSMAGAALRVLRTDLRRMVAGLLDVDGAALWSLYQETYGSLANEFGITVVAPSGYFPDPLDGVIRNLSAVFGPDGSLVGYQTKGMLHPEDQELAQPGGEWRVISTEVGQMGLMLGSDMLYPEVGRVLAYQGAEMLIGQASATDRTLYEKMRSAMLARMQENQLFAALSFPVGLNEFGRLAGSQGRRTPFVGRSAIFAPQELTPQSNGVLVEMTNARSEGVLTAIWDFPELRSLWETSDTPLRSQTPLEQVGPMLARLYQKLRRLPGGSSRQSLLTDLSAATPATAQDDQPIRNLDDLPVIASVTARWPLERPPESPLFAPEDESASLTPAQEEDVRVFVRSAQNASASAEASAVELDDETQEMDALLEPKDKE
jgi:predicted amidohydrolase